jgi:CDP-diacylglycerol---serine O-phosphatidyltransferase
MLKFILKNSANSLTLLSLMFGISAILFSFTFNLSAALSCIFISVILDFLDGKVARLTNSQSNLGLELDSFADLIVFGVATSLINYNFLFNLNYNNYLFSHTLYINFIMYSITLIFPVFSCLRLSIFNIKERSSQSSSKYFSGIPTPAASLLSFFPLLIEYVFRIKIYNEIYFIYILFIAITMLIPIKTPSLKNFSTTVFSTKLLNKLFIFLNILLTIIILLSIYISYNYILMLFVIISIFILIYILFIIKLNFFTSTKNNQ